MALELYLRSVRHPRNLALGAFCRPSCVFVGGIDAGSPPGSTSGQALRTLLSIPIRTLQRWRTWWRVDFALTPFWQSVRERFMPPVMIEQLPPSLLERFDTGEMTDRLAQALRFIAPLSTRAMVR